MKKIIILFLFISFIVFLLPTPSYNTRVNQKTETNQNLGSKLSKTNKLTTSAFNITSNAGFVSVPGITGAGTAINRYVISSLTIEANGYTGIVVSNTTAYFTIENVAINGSNNGKTALTLYNVTNGIVQDCSINNSYYGISIESYSKNNIISHNMIENTNYSISTVYANFTTITNNILLNSTIGINSYLTFGNIIDNNFINYCGFYGLYIGSGSYNANIKNNQVSNCLFGILINEHSNMLTNNTAEFNQHGFYFLGLSTLDIFTGNKAFNNTLDGFLVEASANITLSSNIAEFNLVGFNLYNYNTGVNLQNNTIMLNTNGLYINNGGDKNVIKENKIMNNSQNGILIDNNVLRTIIQNNTITENYDGVTVKNFSNETSIISNYIITNVHAGVNIQLASYRNFIFKNQFELNAIGITFGITTQSNKIIQNNFSNNTITAIDDSNTVNYWYSNTYSDYTNTLYYIVSGYAGSVDLNPNPTYSESTNTTVVLTEITYVNNTIYISQTQSQSVTTSSSTPATDGFTFSTVILLFVVMPLLVAKRKGKK